MMFTKERKMKTRSKVHERKQNRLSFSKHDSKNRQEQHFDAWCEEGGHFFDLSSAAFCQKCFGYICPNHVEDHYHD